MKSGKAKPQEKKTRKKAKSKKTPTVRTASGISASQGRNTTALKGKSRKPSLRALPTKSKADKKDEIKVYSGGLPQTRKFNSEHIHFVIMQLIHVGKVRNILENFQERFGEPISREYVYAIKKNPNYEGTYMKLKDEYEKGLAKEYLTSKRKRIGAVTEIYESSMKRKDYAIASQQIMHVDNMMNPRNAGFNITNLTQNNVYSDMKLDEIRREKAKLLDQLEAAKIEDGEIIE